MAKVRVRELAEAQGFNISTLSRRADISYPAAHALWHSTVLRVDLATLEAVAKVLGVRTGDLIVDDDEPASGGDEGKARGEKQAPSLAA